MKSLKRVSAKSATGMLALAVLMLTVFTLSSAYAENHIQKNRSNASDYYKSGNNTDAPVILESYGGSRHSGGDGSSQQDEYTVDFWGIRINDPQGYENIDSIVAKAPDGSLYQTLSDDGKHCDENPNDAIYGWCGTSTLLPPLTGDYTIVAKDKDGNTDAKTITVERILDIPRNPSPGGSAFINTQTPRLSWNKVDGAVRYNLDIRDKNGNLMWYRGDISGNSIYYNDNGTGQNFTEGNVYHWGVGACDNDDNCSWHHTWIEFVYSTADSPVIFEAYGGSRHSGFDSGSQQDEYSIEFWIRVNDPQGPDTIESVVAKAPDGSIYQTLSDDGEYCDENPGDGIYVWCVWRGDTSFLPLTGDYTIVAKDKDGNTSTKIINIKQILDIPCNLSPCGGTVIRTPNPILTWDSVVGAVKYDLAVNDENGNQMWRREEIIKTSISYNDDGTGIDLIEGNVYYWGVGARDDEDNLSGCHATIKFIYSTTMSLISGKVITNNNQPVENLCMNAHATDSWDWIAGGVTDAKGDYYIGVPAGSYYICTDISCIGNNEYQNYVNTCWKNGGNNDAPVSVKLEQTLSNINFSLAEGGIISGKVSTADGQPIANICVDATGLCGNPYYSGNQTDENGNYSIAVPAGSYYLHTNTSCNTLEDYIGEWWNSGEGTSDCNQAESVNVTVEKTTPDINFSLTEGGRISGKVSTADGQPIANVCINASDSEWYWSGGSASDENGNYSFIVPEGIYQINTDVSCIGNNVKNFFDKYWNEGEGTNYRYEAAPVTVKTGQTTPNINFSLAQGGRISGRVTTSDGKPISDMGLTARFDCENFSLFMTRTDENGDYSVAVPNGTYFIETWRGIQNYVGEWWNGEDGTFNCNEAKGLSISTAQTIPNINFSLAEGGSISGKATMSDGITPVPNLHLYATDYITDQWVGGANTDENGVYTIRGIYTGKYRVNACASCSGLNSQYILDEFYDNALNRIEADSVSVTAGKDTPGINFISDKGGIISGVVTSEDGKPVASVEISVFSNCENLNKDIYYGCFTDENGKYSVTAPEGEYYVKVWTYNAPYYTGECWNGGEGTTDCNKAKAVSVNKEQTTSGINFVLARTVFTIPTASIIIDGNRDDWNNIAPAFTDQVNDQNPNSDFDGTDLSKLYLAKDSMFLYVMMELYDGNPITNMDTLYVFETLQKPFELHTPGDRLAVATCSNGEWMADISERSNDACESLYTYPSSHVGTGTKFIEWKVLLSDIGTLDGRYIRAYIHVIDPPNEVSDGDETGIQLKLSSSVAYTISGGVKNVHEADGSFQTYIDLNIADGFAGTLPDDIESITITAPGGDLPYTKDDFEYEPYYFWIAIPGSPEIGEYKITVKSGDKIATFTDIQSINRNIPISDKNSLYPQDGATPTSKTPIFSWQTVNYTESSLYYRLTVEDMNGNSVFNSGRDFNVNSCTVPTGILKPGETYRWRVRITDSSDWEKIQNRSNSEWLTFTMADTLIHSAKPAIELDQEGAYTYTNSNGTYLDFSIKIIDHDGVAYDGSSHIVTVTFPDGTDKKLENYYRTDSTPGYYETSTEEGATIQPGNYTFTVTDPDGNTATAIDNLVVNLLPPPDEDSFTPSLKNPVNEYITATFDNVYVNGTLYDNFDDYKSIENIDPAKWENRWCDNKGSVSIENGKLKLTQSNVIGTEQCTQPTIHIDNFESVKADVTITDVSSDINSARIYGPLYNNGINDVYVYMIVKKNRVIYSLGHDYINNDNYISWNDLVSGELMTVTPGQTVTASISWDGIKFIFDANENKATYIPTGIISPPNDTCRIRLNVKQYLVTPDTTPTFTWDSVAGATRYRVRIYSEDSAQTIWRGYVNNQTTYTVPPGILLPDETYAYRIDIRDSHIGLDVDNFSKAPVYNSENFIFTAGKDETPTPFIELDNIGVQTWSNEKDGTFLNFHIKVYDAQGVPDNIRSVKVISPTGAEEILDYFTKHPENTNTCGIYQKDSSLLIQGGTYTFRVEDQEGHLYTITENLTPDPVAYPAESSLVPVHGTEIYHSDIYDTSVDFDWADVDDAAFYQLEIYDQDYNKVYKFATTESSYHLAAGFLKKDKVYYYQITTRREFFDQNVDNGSSTASNLYDMPAFVINGDFLGRPEPPENLEARSGKDSVRLFWEPSTSADLEGYNIYRSLSEGGPWSKINTEELADGDTYIDQYEIIPGTTYYYYLTTVNGFGNESEPSNTASVRAGLVKLFIPDSNGKTKEQIRLPINITNADGLQMCSVDIYVTYNADVLKATDIEKSALSAGYGWAKNFGAPGVARAVIATTNGETLYGEGSLFYILFDVIGEANDTSDLEFKIDATYLYDCHDLHNSVPLDLTDNGIFKVNQAYILGDLNGDGVVNSADASIALEIAVGNIEPTQEQKNAGDINGDGRINSADAALILRIAAGLPLAPDKSLRQKQRASSSVTVSIPSLSVTPGESRWIPIWMNDAENVAGADIRLNYDPSVVTVKSVRTTSFTENFLATLNTDQPGQAKISFFSSEDKGLPQGPGTLVELEITALPDASGNSNLTFASLRLSDVFGQDFETSALQIRVNTINGTLKVFSLSDAILGLKILTGMNVANLADSNADAIANGKIELSDVVYILQAIVGQRD